jgi:hypothetical protein
MRCARPEIGPQFQAARRAIIREVPQRVLSFFIDDHGLEIAASTKTEIGGIGNDVSSWKLEAEFLRIVGRGVHNIGATIQGFARCIEVGQLSVHNEELILISRWK